MNHHTVRTPKNILRRYWTKKRQIEYRENWFYIKQREVERKGSKVKMLCMANLFILSSGNKVWRIIKSGWKWRVLEIDDPMTWTVHFYPFGRSTLDITSYSSSKPIKVGLSFWFLVISLWNYFTIRGRIRNVERPVQQNTPKPRVGFM